MKQISFACVAFVVALTACGSKSSNSPGSQPDEDLRAEALNAQPLAASDKASFHALFKSSNEQFPDTDLYFDKYSDAKKKQADLAKLNYKGQALLNAVKGNCKITPVTSTTQGDGSKIGQPVATTSVSNIGDTDDALGKCPISYTQNDVSTSTVIAMDVNTKIWSSTVHDESNSSQTYLDPEFAKIPLANWISTSVSDVALIQVQSNIDGSIKSGSITSTGHTTVEAKQTNGENATVKMKFSSIQTSGHASEKVLMKFTGLNGIAPVVLGIFKTDKSDPEIILNGEMYSAERLKKDTGIDVSSDGNIK